ncbi:MAG: hypothetical protein ACKO68_04000, partial [Bacteroidota bacterium]
MKHFLLLIFAISLGFKAQSQCTATSQYPFNTLTPTSAWSNVDPCNYAGEYAVINVVAGNVYEFSTMGIHGSTISYDTQLTLRNATNALIAYNDDYQGTLQSYISWTASYTGTARIHLHLYSCQSNSTCSNIRFKVTAPVAPAPANNNCANATPLTPSAVCNLTNGTTAGATEDAIPDPSCDPGAINDVWYSFNSGNYTSLNLTVNLVSASWIGVELFTGCGTLAQNTTLGGNAGNCDFNTSAPNPTVIGGLTPNTNYTFRLFTNVTYDIAGSFTTCLTTPPPPTVTVNSSSVCVGQSVTLTATPSSAGGTYLWSNGATTPSITVTPNATTTYSVTYTNNGAGSGSGTVTVNPLPAINGGQDQTGCQGANVTLSATGGTSYTWNNGVSNGVAFVPNTTTTYTVTGTDANGCQGTDQVTVTVNLAPTINVSNLAGGPNLITCAGSMDMIMFFGPATTSFNWVNSDPSIGLISGGGGIQPMGAAFVIFQANNPTLNPITSILTVTPTQAGCTGAPQTFTITVNPNPTITGLNAVCAGATIQLTGSGTAAANNAWVSGTPANGTVSNSGVVTGVSAGNTIITYTNS